MKQPVDSFFKEKLKNFNPEVPASAWNRIDANLAPKKKPLVWLKIAAGILLPLLAGMIIYTEINQHPVQSLAQVDNMVPADKEIKIEAPVVTPAETKIEIPQQEVNPQQKERPLPNQVLPSVIKNKKDIPEKSTDKQLVENPVELTITPSVMVAENEMDFPMDTKTVATEPEVEPTPEKNTTIVISAAEANAKYLNQQFIADATPENKKSSKLRNLFEKAQDLDPIGEIRQLKNEVLALNFRNEKKGERNR